MRADYWKARAKNYGRLEWIRDVDYINAILSSTPFDRWDSILDVGTGTGIMAKAVSPYVYIVFGLDNSKEMLKKAVEMKNIFYIEGDVRDIRIPDHGINKVIARSVFHHLGENVQEAMDECYRVLKSRGKMILAQAIPPLDEIVDEYAEIMKLKDDRTVQTEKDLVALMDNAGFSNIKTSAYILKSFSVRNWLENNALSKDTRERIFTMHVNGSEQFKIAHNLITVNGDCLIDVKNAIIVGEK